MHRTIILWLYEIEYDLGYTILREYRKTMPTENELLDAIIQLLNAGRHPIGNHMKVRIRKIRIDFEVERDEAG